MAETLREMTDDAWCDSSGDLARKAFEADFADSRAADRLLDIYQPLPGRWDEESDKAAEDSW